MEGDAIEGLRVCVGREELLQALNALYYNDLVLMGEMFDLFGINLEHKSDIWLFYFLIQLCIFANLF